MISTKYRLRTSMWQSHQCIAAMLLLLGVGGLNAGLDLEPRSNKLANANQFGYARIVKELGAWHTDTGQPVPINLIFESDPNLEPGVFGPGWKLPLFASTAFLKDADAVAWVGPDEYRRFFRRDLAPKDDSRSRETLYGHQAGEWLSKVDKRDNRITISNLDDPELVYVYEDGRLEEFCMGAGTPVYHIDYNSRGYPRRVISDPGRQTVFEIEYLGSTPERVIIGNSKIIVDMGDGDWTAPDGRSDYKDYRVKFLRALDYGDEQVVRFTYLKGDEPKKRQVQTPSQQDPKKLIPKQLTLPVNRLLLSSSGGTESWVEFEARSGFITKDSGGDYSVSNAAYDPHQEGENKRGRISPGLVRLERMPKDGSPKQLWSKYWQNGIETYSEPDGTLVRKIWMRGVGPAYGKLRKVERQVTLNNGKVQWVTSELRSYNSNGRLMRLNDINGDYTEINLYTNYMLDSTDLLDMIRKIGNAKIIQHNENGDLIQSLSVNTFSGGEPILTKFNREGEIELIRGRGFLKKYYSSNSGKVLHHEVSSFSNPDASYNAVISDNNFVVRYGGETFNYKTKIKNE